MKGSRYVRNISNLADCTNFDDEICNSGPTVWIPLMKLYESKCKKPSKIITYAESAIEYIFHNFTNNETGFQYVAGSTQIVESELLVYDTNDMIGSIGGSLGLFLGFSFFGIISQCIDMFLQLATKIQQCERTS